jgi:hypothetical protein
MTSDCTRGAQSQRASDFWGKDGVVDGLVRFLREERVTSYTMKG